MLGSRIIMRLMLDTNILIDHIGRREPFYELSRRTCLLGITGVAETFISATMITDIHYLLSKDFGNIEAQRMIEEDLGFLEIVGVSSQDVCTCSKMERFRRLPCCALRKKGCSRLHYYKEHQRFLAVEHSCINPKGTLRRTRCPRNPL